MKEEYQVVELPQDIIMSAVTILGMLHLIQDISLDTMPMLRVSRIGRLANIMLKWIS